MVSDSFWTDGDNKGPCRKVYRIKGQLVGVAGSVKDESVFLEWYKKGAKGEGPKGDVTALILSESSVKTWCFDDGFFEPGNQFAIGTGGAIARAVMMTGADARTAVRIATKIDAQSGGPVRAYRL
jgi:hypothetical protein